MSKELERRRSISMLWIAAPLLLVSTAALLFYYSGKWQHWRPATCMPASCFCEQIRPGAISQPANTWSSLSFVLVGLAILFGESPFRGVRLQSKIPKFHIDHVAVLAVYVFSLTIIGMGSAFYHASLTFVGQFFDVMGMYLFITFVILLNLSRLKKLSRSGFTGWFIILNSVLGYFLIVIPECRRYVFGGLVVAAVTLELVVRKRKNLKARGNYLFWALAIFGLAFLLWVLDITKILCEPTSWLQGHALWHTLGAVAAGLLYLHYGSEAKVRMRLQPEK